MHRGDVFIEWTDWDTGTDSKEGKRAFAAHDQTECSLREILWA